LSASRGQAKTMQNGDLDVMPFFAVGHVDRIAHYA